MKRIISAMFILFFLSTISLYSSSYHTYKIQVPKDIVLNHHPDWATLDLDNKEFILVVNVPWKLKKECMRSIVEKMDQSECVHYGYQFILVDRKEIETGKFKVDFVFFK